MGIFLALMQFLLISLLIQILLASSLTLFGKTKNKKEGESDLKFDELFLDYSEMPEKKTYMARDGIALNYREYLSEGDNVIIMIHGSGWHSQYFYPMAKEICVSNSTTVLTPDLRGHGSNPLQRGDINYINQLEDDLADFITITKNKFPSKSIHLLGHSSGGGLVIRFAGSKYNHLVNSYLLLSPFLKYNAPTVRKNSGGWAHPYLPRIIGLSIFNSLRIPFFNYLPVIEFQMPEDAKDGTETLKYSYRLNTGYAPRNYKKDLTKIKVPVLLIVGENDESFIANAFEDELKKYVEIEFHLLPETTHMGVVLDKKSVSIINDWIG